jgi:hypothetical protein
VEQANEFYGGGCSKGEQTFLLRFTSFIALRSACLSLTAFPSGKFLPISTLARNLPLAQNSLTEEKK